MLNNVVLIGRLVRDPELRYTPNNTAVANVTIAVDRSRKNDAGEREADFINLVIWGKTAENFANWIKKGNLVSVTGRIETRNYENQEGKKVYVTEVVVNQFFNLTPRNNSGEGAYPQQQGQYQQQGQFQQQQQNQGFGNGYQQPQQTPDFSRDQNPFGGGNPMDISDDDLPF